LEKKNSERKMKGADSAFQRNKKGTVEERARRMVWNYEKGGVSRKTGF